MSYPLNFQQSYLKQLNERDAAEKSQFKEVVHDYIEILQQLKKAQEQLKIFERENYALKITKGDALQIVKLQQQVLELEAQLKDLYKGQIGNNQEVIQQVKENKELAEKLREMEKKAYLYHERMKDYEQILKKQDEDGNKSDFSMKKLKEEITYHKQIISQMEQKVQDLQTDNQMLVANILELKNELAKSFNEVNKIYKEAQRIKVGSMKKCRGDQQEEQKEPFLYGSNIDISAKIRPEQLIGNYSFVQMNVPSRPEVKIAAHKKEATCLSFNAGGDIAVTGGADCLVKLWNTNSGKEIGSLKGASKTITDVSISLDNELIAGASNEYKVFIWRMKTMRPEFTFIGHKDSINACKFSVIKKSLITGSLDRTIRTWDLEKNICRSIVTCFSQCFDLNISLTESFFATSHFDGNIRLWSVNSGELQSEIKNAHEGVTTSVRITPDEKYIVSTGKDHVIKVFDIRNSNQELHKFSDTHYKCESNNNRLTISPNSKFAIVGSSNGSIIAYDLIKGELEEIYENAHTTGIVSCCWQPKGDKFASIDNLGSLYIWQQ